MQQAERFYVSLGYASPASFWTESDLYPVPQAGRCKNAPGERVARRSNSDVHR